MAELERTYTIPLRREWLRVPKYKRAKRAIHAVQNFLKRHMRAELENVKVGNSINLEIWKHGIRNPPSRVRITTKKDDNGIVFAEMFGKPFPAKKEEKKEKGLKDKVLETVGVKKEDHKSPEVKKEVVKEESKKIAKESSKAIKTELKKLDEKTEQVKKEKVAGKKEN